MGRREISPAGGEEVLTTGTLGTARNGRAVKPLVINMIILFLKVSTLRQTPLACRQPGQYCAEERQIQDREVILWFLDMHHVLTFRFSTFGSHLEAHG